MQDNKIPYWTSPPLIFTYRQTAELIAGQFVFPASVKQPFTPSRPILPNALYRFNTIDFAMDVAEIDYEGAIAVLPQYSMYMQSNASGPSFREPIPLSKYFTILPYYLTVLGSELLGDAYPGSSPTPGVQGFNFNRLLGNIAGTLNQTPTLLGKQSLTAVVVMTAQEIVDSHYINEFKKQNKGQQPTTGKVF